MKKKYVFVVFGLVGIVVFVGCGGGGVGLSGGFSVEGFGDKGDLLIGVFMFMQILEWWIVDGNVVQDGLEEVGYQVDLQYVGDDILIQGQQIDQMIMKGVDLFVIVVIDGMVLLLQFDVVVVVNILVIFYDCLICDSEYVDFYVIFDNYKVGVQQVMLLFIGFGVFDEDGKEIGEKGLFNIELFVGFFDDNNVYFFWQGVMDMFQLFIDDGVFVVLFGQIDIEQVVILCWQQEMVQKWMEDLLILMYVGGIKFDGVLFLYDGFF